MRDSRRLKRMSRNRLKIMKMPLTSLMDVFTILVFFLLVNSGSVEILDALLCRFKQAPSIRQRAGPRRHPQKRLVGVVGFEPTTRPTPTQ